MISKKKLLILCFFGVGFCLAFGFSREIALCPPYSYSSCSGVFNGLAEVLIPIFSLLIFSLITYKMRDEVYQAWFRFARWWIPLSMLAILTSPEYSADWMFSIEKGSVAFVTSLLFIIISLLIIAWKYFSTRRSGQV